MDVFIKKLMKSNNNSLSVGKVYNIRTIKCEDGYRHLLTHLKYNQFLYGYMYLGEKK